MSNVEKLALAFGVVFVLVVIVVFRWRWQAALGWVLIAGAFIVEVLNHNNVTLLSSIIAALVIIVGIGLVGYNYYRYERPKRLARRTMLDDPPNIKVRRRPLLRRRRFTRGERH